MSSAFTLTLTLVALAGCGGSSSSSGNGIASKSAEEIVSESKLAADSASSVHIAGSINTGAPVTLNLHLVADKGGTGEISLGGISFKLILLGDTAYMSGSSTFYRHIGGAAAAQLLAGKWLKVSASTGEFAAFAQLADMRKLIDSTLTSHGKLVKGATTTVNGQPAITITDSTGGLLYVATTGKPYPIEITKTGSESGKITFDEWNHAVSVAAPTNSIDLAELKAAGSH